MVSITLLQLASILVALAVFLLSFYFVFVSHFFCWLDPGTFFFQFCNVERVMIL